MDRTPRNRPTMARPGALLLALFILGCDDPVAPDTAVPNAPNYAKGGTTSTTFAVAAEGAMTTPAAPQVVSSWVKETSDQLQLLSDNTFRVAFNFVATREAALADLSADGTLEICFIDGGRNTTIPRERVERAINKLVLAEGSRNFSLSVDKTALGSASEKHGVGSPSFEQPEGLYALRLGSSYGAATATLVSGDINGDSEIRYTDGTVYVKDRTQRPHFHVICPNLDAVVVRITRGS